MPLQALIVDDHEAVREGLVNMFEGTSVQIAGKAGDSQEAMSLIPSLASEPGLLDIVLLDVQMPSEDGLTTLVKIRADYPALPIVMLSAYDNPIYVARASANGAHDFVLKSDPPPLIIRAISYAVERSGPHPDGLLYQIRSTLQAPVDTRVLPPEFPLTSREAQVLRHVAMGLSNREIASSLEISVETVKEHVQNILRKTNSSDRTDAAVRAVRFGLVN
ncbi:response regulator transcription factor [Stieleria varia]|uniref:Transcriptional regulatory protein DegU n=1 Tax=Stieleria varia TaxID=2528005 RepID=A0A5C6B2K4_9BACT|nr:response regulator transcription factor [Stieleria varia]TWU05682.1 Transcriptional regulatory protein DegU [Stieleria varia]